MALLRLINRGLRIEDSIEDITVKNPKFRLIIAQSHIYTYNAAKVIADYLKPVSSDNDYIIRNIQEFPKLLQRQDPILPNEEYVWYDVKSLFTNVPIQETWADGVNGCGWCLAGGRGC